MDGRGREARCAPASPTGRLGRKSSGCSHVPRVTDIHVPGAAVISKYVKRGVCVCVMGESVCHLRTCCSNFGLYLCSCARMDRLGPGGTGWGRFLHFLWSRKRRIESAYPGSITNVLPARSKADPPSPLPSCCKNQQKEKHQSL